SSPRGGKRPRKGDGGDSPPSDGDRLFAQKCQELRGFIRPLAELLEGLKRGRYDRGLSSFQQSVAMDRIQRIIGVLQKPEMGARYLGTLLQVEGMLRVWFPHVAPKPAQDPAPSPAAATPPRRRPPAGPPRSTPLSTSAWGRPPFQPHGDVGDITSRGAPQRPGPPGAGVLCVPWGGAGGVGVVLSLGGGSEPPHPAPGPLCWDPRVPPMVPPAPPPGVGQGQMGEGQAWSPPKVWPHTSPCPPPQPGPLGPGAPQQSPPLPRARCPPSRP
uniref:Circadian associated repressor of transcription n=1 Tax=Aquila chrysaetos chrysaetos TaxID=223781 RepID=A0A663DW38_AQUCH